MLPPVNVTWEAVSSNASTGQVRYVAGVNDRIRAAPIVPVWPVTVIVMVPPRFGGLGFETSVVTWFALAWIVS